MPASPSVDPASAKRPAILARPSLDELRALLRYARAHGGSWKSDLNLAWSNGRDEREPDVPSLRRVRNTIGPSGLTKFALNGLEAELAARAGAA